MKFKEWLAINELDLTKNVFRSKPTQPELYRILNGQFTPEEMAIVKKQKEEMAKFGVVFTPFQFYGGMKNPTAQPLDFTK